MSDTKQVIVVRKDLNMRKGKIAAQVAHAAMAFISRQLQGSNPEAGTYKVKLGARMIDWVNSSYAKVVVSVDSEEELRRLIQQGRMVGLEVHEVIDSGRTEFHGVPTLTCAAFGPDMPERLDPITGQLKLL